MLEARREKKETDSGVSSPNSSIRKGRGTGDRAMERSRVTRAVGRGEDRGVRVSGSVSAAAVGGLGLVKAAAAVALIRSDRRVWN